MGRSTLTRTAEWAAPEQDGQSSQERPGQQRPRVLRAELQTSPGRRQAPHLMAGPPGAGRAGVGSTRGVGSARVHGSLPAAALGAPRWAARRGHVSLEPAGIPAPVRASQTNPRNSLGGTQPSFGSSDCPLQGTRPPSLTFL